MKLKTLLLICLTSILAISIYAHPVVAVNDNQNMKNLTRLIVNNLPADNAETAEMINSSIIELGSDAIMEMCAMLAPSGQEDDSQARTGLEGLAFYVTRSGMNKEQEMFVKVILRALERETEIEVKAFLIHLLQLTAGDEAVQTLSQFLRHDQLNDPSVRALTTIGTEKAKAALLHEMESLADAQKLAVIKALGELRYAAATDKILKYADSPNKNLSKAALFALANIGTSKVEPFLDLAMTTDSHFQKSEWQSMYLNYANQLWQNGDSTNCLRICQKILTTDQPKFDSNVQSVALATVVDVKGVAALPQLLHTMDSGDPELILTALQLGNRFPQKEVTQQWVEKMQQIDDSGIRSKIIAMLGNRGDKSALSAILQAFKGQDTNVKQSAIRAAAKLGGQDALPSLLEMLKNCNSEDDVSVLKEVLLTLPIHQRSTALVKILPKSQAIGKVAILELFAERDITSFNKAIFKQSASNESRVRLAAIKALGELGTNSDMQRLFGRLPKTADENEITVLQRAIVKIAARTGQKDMLTDQVSNKMRKAGDTTKQLYLKLLGKIGGEKALKLVVAEITSNNEEIHDTAIRTIIDWPDETALEQIFKIAEGSEDLRYNVLALQGCSRILKVVEMPDIDKVKTLAKAINLARRPEEKKLILGALGEFRSKESLEIISRYFADDSVSYEAAIAALNIAAPEDDNDKTLANSEIAMALIEPQISTATFKNLKDQIQSRHKPDESSNKTTTDSLQTRSMAESSAHDLFNGKDLTGWEQIGGPEMTWHANKGILFTEGHGGGWISTTSEYGDFILELEFRVPKGGNSGVFLRAPHTGDPAYTGMEVQILDDYADKYADLKPWQYTGSIYGIQAPSERVTKKANNWQKMQIVCNGPSISVTLNGTKIIDTNLIQHMDKTKTHPGIKRRKGFIGLQNHGSKLEFRNIRITGL